MANSPCVGAVPLWCIAKKMAGNGWPLQNELSTAVNEILLVELQSLKGSCATNQRRLRLIIKNTKKLSSQGSSL
jgi:hypothetical protein